MVVVWQGYRWYDSHKVTPKYAFGHGLSYSNFSYSGLEVNGMTVSCSVKNTGAVDGTEIAQLYLVRRLARNSSRKPFTLERPSASVCRAALMFVGLFLHDRRSPLAQASRRSCSAAFRSCTSPRAPPPRPRSCSSPAT